MAVAGRARPEPLERLEQPVDLGGGMTGPEFATDSTAPPPSLVEVLI